MYFHPLFINWENELIIIIGGGKIAERKILSLLQTKANIHVISPAITSSLQQLVQQKQIIWTNEKYSHSHCQHAFFVIAATANNELNRNIIEDAKKLHIPLTLNISEHETGNVIMPAIVEHDSFQIAISSNGTNPRATKQFKKKLDDILNN